jgi:hypothetical protein
VVIPRSPNNFAVQLIDLSFNQPQNTPPRIGQEVVLARARAGVLAAGALEPSMPFHSVQERIKRARTDLVAMTPQFADDPLPIEGALGSMLENMDFPKTKKNFPGYETHFSLQITTTIDDSRNIVNPGFFPASRLHPPYDPSTAAAFSG